MEPVSALREMRFQPMIAVRSQVFAVTNQKKLGAASSPKIRSGE
jgi:hypothetical protein